MVDSFKPQTLLVEERGLENQIKRIKDLIPSKTDAQNNKLMCTVGYLRESLATIVEGIEDIKIGIKHENDRILKDKLINNK